MTIPFRPIARLLAATLHPAPRLDLGDVQGFLRTIGHENQKQGVLVTVNHYFAPDFHAWWFTILISATIPKHIHWVVTSGWTNSGWLTGFTHWLFPVGARLLGFTPMPAMPPNPAETEMRALAVRKVINYARRYPGGLIGMAPEGRDIPGGELGSLPAGVGRFMQVISQYYSTVLPVGVWTENGRIHLKFGRPYHLDVPPGLSAPERDRFVGDTIMYRIAQCLPEQLRGNYS